MAEKLFARPESLRDVPFHYCPGCHHGIIHRLVAETIDELGIRGKTIGVVPVGCSVLAYEYFNFDTVEAAHGRAPAVATGGWCEVFRGTSLFRRINPDLTLIGLSLYWNERNHG